MGQRGPQPTQDAVLGRRGSRRANRRRPKPAPLPGPPHRPENLSPAATLIWDTYEPILAAMGVLSEGDGLVLELLAETFAEWDALRRDIREHGRVHWSKDLNPRPRPEYRMMTDAQARLVRLCRELGLSPSARTVVRVVEKAKQEQPEKIT